MREDPVQLRVMAATLASVAVHVGLAWTLAETKFGVLTQVSNQQADTSLVIPLAFSAPSTPEQTPPPEAVVPPEPRKVPPPPPAEPPEATPGIDRSDAKTDAWIGFDKATEQRARKSESDQSAVTPSPGLPVEVSPPAPPPQAPQESGPPAPAEPKVDQPDPAEQRAPSGGGDPAPAAPTTPPVPDPKPQPEQTKPQEATQPDGPEGEGKAARGTKNGVADVPPRDEVPQEVEAPAKPVKDGTAVLPDAPATEASKAAAAEAKDEQGKEETKLDTTGDVSDAAKEKVAGERMKDPDGVYPEEKPEQRLAQAALAPEPMPLGVVEAPVGPPVPAWLRTLGELEQAEAQATPPETAAQQQAGPQAKSPTAQAAAPKPLPAAGTPAAGDAPGEKSDSEASATSVIEVSTLQFGKVLARQGLKIRTVRPRFSLTTLLTGAPRDATMDIVFGRDGSVIRAAFQPGQTTGSEEIDSVLLRAAYRWEAAGEELEKLPVGKPDAGVTIKIKFVLR